LIGNEPLLINDEFNAILDMVEQEQEHLFITGRAGTGKSTLLSLLKKTTRKNAVVLAPTGIAALNVGGQTIHSFFRLPPKMLDPQDITKRKNHHFYKKLKLLIIDEISMVRADLIDTIDIFLRINIEKNIPFGGVQLVVFGDLFQLPPVVSSAFERKVLREKYGSPYFFSASVFQELDLRMIELRTVYRQTERNFINLLDNIRTRRFDYDDLMEINNRFEPEIVNEDLAITLCSTNATVNKINSEKLKALPGHAYEFKAKLGGEFNPRLCPAEQYLLLKEQAQVMFVKNDAEGRFVNGTLGRVVSINSDTIQVKILQKGEYNILEVEPLEWELLKYEVDHEDNTRFKTRIAGTFTQYPLKLAWAMTIHKSQGKTFDRVNIDLGRGAFDHGQTYVALSRCRTLEGISLNSPIKPKDIMVDEVIVEYYDTQSRR